MSRIRYIKPGFFTDEDLADAITRLVGRYAKELAASGMSASEAEETAIGWIAEEVNLPVEEVRRRARSMSSTRFTRGFWRKVRARGDVRCT